MAEATKTKKTSDNTAVFAVVETGGKQYKVSEGDTILVEKLAEEHKEGDTITLDSVLLVDDGKNTSIGDPYIPNAKVEAELLENGRSKKISVLKYRSKSRYFRNKGHRQPYSKLKIRSIR